MQLRNAASGFGRVVVLIPLILIFLTAADSAFACPGQTNGVAYRTKGIKTRTASYMPTTVISYRAPASYRRCGNSLYDTRGARYVANGNHHSGARYVAVRNGNGYYKTARTRYVAVRNADYYDDEPRYVAVRRRPVYVDEDVRYVAVRRSAPRVRYVAVRNDYEDDDDDVRYVPVRNYAPRTRYVTVRDSDTGCMRAVALRSCHDEVETVSTKRAVYQNGDPYANDIAFRNEIDNDDDEYTEAPKTSYVDNDDETYDNGYMATRTISYSPASYYDNDDDDDQMAYLDGGRTTYVAADNTQDACMTRVAVSTPREVVSTEAVSYVPVEDVEESPYQTSEDMDAAPLIRYVALDEDRVFDDVDPAYAAAAEEVAADTVGYAPAEDMQAVSYVPADDAEQTETVSYVPADDMNATTVSYVPVADMDTEYVADDACPIAVSGMDAETSYVADDSTVFVEDSTVAMSGTKRLAGSFGYRDGFEDGREAALEADEYHPENSGDFQKATEGYEDDYGDKDTYKDAYRNSYLDGYQAGFNSAASTS